MVPSMKRVAQRNPSRPAVTGLKSLILNAAANENSGPVPLSKPNYFVNARTYDYSIQSYLFFSFRIRNYHLQQAFSSSANIRSPFASHIHIHIYIHSRPCFLGRWDSRHVQVVTQQSQFDHDATQFCLYDALGRPICLATTAVAAVYLEKGQQAIGSLGRRTCQDGHGRGHFYFQTSACNPTSNAR
jgi:hypothetical protein